jgi:hypothetical protein
MKKANIAGKTLPRLHQFMESVCGLYSRVANRLNVDRSYVSRVARGERHSAVIERALTSEYKRIENDQQKP